MTTSAGAAGPAISIRSALLKGKALGAGEAGPLDLEVCAGECLSLLGSAVLGLSSILRAIAGLEPLRAGEVLIGGTRVEGPFGDLGIVRRRPALLGWRSVLSNILFQVEGRKLKATDYLDQARRLLVLMGLQGREDALPGRLTADEMIRVATCRALVHEPSILLMDDPMRGSDALSRERYWSDVQRLRLTPSRTVVLATSNVEEAIIVSDRVVILNPGGRQAASVDIELPRPRRIDRTMAPRIAEYGAQLRTHLHAHGLLY